MIGAIVGAGVGLAKSVVGGLKSAKARERQEELLRDQRNRNEALFNRDYYQDYMGRSDVQAAMNRVRETMKRSNERADNMAAITGATPEATLAQKENSAKAIADTASAIQANQDANKDAITARYQQADNAIANAQVGQEQATEAGMANMADQGLATGAAIATSAINNNTPKTPATDLGKRQAFGQAQSVWAKKAMDTAIDADLAKKRNTNYTSVWNQ